MKFLKLSNPPYSPCLRQTLPQKYHSKFIENRQNKLINISIYLYIKSNEKFYY